MFRWRRSSGCPMSRGSYTLTAWIARGAFGVGVSRVFGLKRKSDPIIFECYLKAADSAYWCRYCERWFDQGSVLGVYRRRWAGPWTPCCEGCLGVLVSSVGQPGW